MRLVCPNCEAKYEVPDDAIPDTGRDVQCANCSHAWFQMPPRTGLAAAETAAVAPPVKAEPGPEAEPVEATPPVEKPLVEDPPAVEPPVEVPDVQEPEVEEPEPTPSEVPEEAPVEIPLAEPEDAPEEEPQEEPTPEEESRAAPVTEEAGAPAYKVDDSVLAILREEAEREARARRAETSFPETQPELGIETVAAAAPLVAAPPVATPVIEEAKPSARRDLLPDVEEINSSLRPADHPQDDEPAAEDMPPPAPEPRGGFRSGFLMVMTLAMLASGLYIAAPSLARMVPALEGPLDSYVALINGLRLQLDGVMQQATIALNGG